MSFEAKVPQINLGLPNENQSNVFMMSGLPTNPLDTLECRQEIGGGNVAVASGPCGNDGRITDGASVFLREFDNSYLNTDEIREMRAKDKNFPGSVGNTKYLNVNGVNTYQLVKKGSNFVGTDVNNMDWRIDVEPGIVASDETIVVNLKDYCPKGGLVCTISDDKLKIKSDGSDEINLTDVARQLSAIGLIKDATEIIVDGVSQRPCDTKGDKCSVGRFVVDLPIDGTNIGGVNAIKVAEAFDNSMGGNTAVGQEVDKIYLPKETKSKTKLDFKEFFAKTFTIIIPTVLSGFWLSNFLKSKINGARKWIDEETRLKDRIVMGPDDRRGEFVIDPEREKKYIKDRADALRKAKHELENPNIPLFPEFDDTPVLNPENSRNQREMDAIQKWIKDTTPTQETKKTLDEIYKEAGIETNEIALRRIQNEISKRQQSSDRVRSKSSSPLE